MGHGVRGTALPPSLEQTMGGACSHPSMAAGTQDNRRGEFPSQTHTLVRIST